MEKKKVWYRHGDHIENPEGEKKLFCAKCDLFETIDHMYSDKHDRDYERALRDDKWFKKEYKPKGYQTGKNNLFL